VVQLKQGLSAQHAGTRDLHAAMYCDHMKIRCTVSRCRRLCQNSLSSEADVASFPRAYSETRGLCLSPQTTAR